MSCEDLYFCQNEICDGKKNGMKTLLKINADKFTEKTKYSWAQPFQCQICNATFYSCNICNQIKFETPTIIKSRLPRHNLLHFFSITPNIDVNEYKRQQT